MNDAVTHEDNGFSKRLSALVNRVIYGATFDDESDPHEIAAAKLYVKWALEEYEGK